MTSVCRPLGEKYGDSPSVGYELLFGQVTRAQGLFSPRATHIHFSLEYIAQNLEVPTTILQYPNKKELISELKKNYDIVGISFVLATFHRTKEIVALIRKHSPTSKIVLGGYGTVLADDVLKPYADYICREEGVAFMRRLLQESEIPIPYSHPLVVSRLRIFGREVSQTGMIFAGLGCPNGCDFCSTSHFFGRKHIKLLPTGEDIFHVVKRYHQMKPDMPLVILDEDFLLNKKRAMAFRNCVLNNENPLSIFAFASVRAISQYSLEEIVEMGIDGLWIGYEGRRSGFGKQSGKPVEELIAGLREYGVSVLASMIVGFPYQTAQIIEEELAGLLSLKPTLAQFLIYGPIQGTPFFDRVMKGGLMHEKFAENPDEYYRKCCGFTAMVKHTALTPQEIEALQKKCFQKDYHELGPSIYRSLEVYLSGYLKLINSKIPILRKKAALFANEIRRAYPLFLAGKILGPNAKVRRLIQDLEKKIHATFGKPNIFERVQSFLALGMALLTGIQLKLGLFQHPKLMRHTFRIPVDLPP